MFSDSLAGNVQLSSLPHPLICSATYLNDMTKLRSSRAGALDAVTVLNQDQISLL
jgi:hypothetical protein